MNVLVACEESQEVCKAFRGKGHNVLFHATYKSAPGDIQSGIYKGMRNITGGQSERAKARSKTFPGIAKAMAEQWGG